VGCVVLVCDSDLLRHCPGGRRLCDQAQPAEQAQGPGTQRSAPRRRRGRSPGSPSRPLLAMSCKPQSRRMRRARRRRRPSESGSARWGSAPIGSTCCARAQTSSSRAVGPGCGRASSTCGGRSVHISPSIPSRPTGGACLGSKRTGVQCKEVPARQTPHETGYVKTSVSVRAVPAAAS